MEYTIREDLAKKNHYHIAEEGKEFSLCGKKVKEEDHPMFMWGYKGDDSTYCDECSKEYRG